MNKKWYKKYPTKKTNRKNNSRRNKKDWKEQQTEKKLQCTCDFFSSVCCFNQDYISNNFICFLCHSAAYGSLKRPNGF